MNDIKELSLLYNYEIWGNDNEGKLEVLKKYGLRSAITDLVILTGGRSSDDWLFREPTMVPDDKSLKGRTGVCYTQSSDGVGGVLLYPFYFPNYATRCSRAGNIRPVLRTPLSFDEITSHRFEGYNGCEEVECGEYPQYAPSVDVQETLEQEYQKGNLHKTGKSYTFDSTHYDKVEQSFQPVTYDEYEYNGKKFIRIKALSFYDGEEITLSNGQKYRDGDDVWVEVSPVRWLVDDKTKTLVSKRGLLSGIRFTSNKDYYTGNFATTDMKEYLDTYMLKDLLPSVTVVKDMPSEAYTRPYTLKFVKRSSR